MIIEFWKEGLNPITCYKTSREINRSPERMNLDTPSLNKKIGKAIQAKANNTDVRVRPSKGEHPNAVKIIVEDMYEQKIPFLSGVEAAAYLKIKPGTLYNILRGGQKNPTKFKIYKS